MFKRITQAHLHSLQGWIWREFLHRDSLIVDIFTKNDHYEEFLENLENVTWQIDLHRTILQGIYFSDPARLSLQNLLSQRVEHMDEAVFVKSVRSYFALSFPEIVWLWKYKRASEKVLENSFKQASFVDLCIFRHNHVLDDLWIRDKERNVTGQVQKKIWVVFRIVLLPVFNLILNG